MKKNGTAIHLSTQKYVLNRGNKELSQVLKRKKKGGETSREKKTGLEKGCRFKNVLLSFNQFFERFDGGPTSSLLISHLRDIRL